MDPAEFSGTVTARRAAPDFVLERLNYRAGQVVPAHYHATPAIVLLSTGRCVLRSDLCCRRPLAPGAAVFHPAGELHSYRYDAACDSQMLAITLLPDSRDRLRAELDLEHPRFAHDPQLILHLRRRLEQPRTSTLSLESAIFELLAAVCGHEKDSPAPVALARARALLRDCFKEPPSLGEIARAAGLPPLQLARHFRRQFGFSPGVYVRRLRIQYACERLAASGIAVVDLAHELGFFDQSHFCHTFKNYVGIAPSDYRQKHRQR